MKWISIDSYHQKPKEGVLYSISDGKNILHDMCLIGPDWYWVNDEDPTIISPTHYLVMGLP